MDSTDHVLLQAINCVENGGYELVLRKLEGGTARAGNRCMDHYFRALAHRAMGDAESAIAEYLQALAQSGLTQVSSLKGMMRRGMRDATGFFNRGCACHNEGDLDRAIDHYTEAIRLEPDRTMALLNRGLAFKARDRNNPAGASYDERHGGTPDCDRAEDDLMAVLKLTASTRLRAVAREQLTALKWRTRQGFRAGTSRSRGCCLT